MRARNLSMGGVISWHLLSSFITKNKTLVIEIEQRVLAGLVDSMTVSVHDYVIAKGDSNNGLEFVYGIYACDNCESLIDKVTLSDEYESVCIRTFEKDLRTNASRCTGLKHWGESHCSLSLRYQNKTHRFGVLSEELVENV